jgi:putative ABC transport system permease protein
VDAFLRDLRHAARSLRRSPGLTAVAILTLAAGLGANVALFSLVRSTLIRPLPFADDERLCRIYLVPEAGSPLISLSSVTFLEVRRQQRSFSGIVGQRHTNTTLQTDEGPQRLVGIAVTAGWAEVLGIAPELGRAFTPEEERAGGDAGVVLVSHGLWQREFGGDPGVLGRTLILNGRVHTVVGVLPPGFRFPYQAEIWFPMSEELLRTAGLNVQARLAPGTSLEQARADLATVAARLAQELPERHRGYSLTAVPTRATLVEDRGSTLVLLLAAAGFILLVACANLANLLLARGVSRHREMTVRAALGASRASQFRLVLTESLLLTLVGAAAGLALALWGVQGLAPLIPHSLASVLPGVAIDAPVFAFALSAALLTALLVGLAPALKASWGNLTMGLRAGGRGAGSGGGPRRLLEALVICEIALALVPLVGAGWLVENLVRLEGAELGYDPAELTLFSVPLDQGEVARPERRAFFLRQAVERLAILPGVDGAGATSIFPSPGANTLSRVEVEGRPSSSAEQPLANYRQVTPGFLEALGLAPTRGRLPTWADGPDSLPVVVISGSMARRFWPGEDPIGRRLRSVRTSGETPWLTVIGVVPDVREFDEVIDTWYLPFAQTADSPLAGRATFAVRRPGGLGAAEARRIVRELDRTLPIYDLESAAETYGASLSEERFSAGLLGLFAGFGLVLATLGVYGVLSYAVNRRRSEIGLRMALGARPDDIRREVVLRGGRLAALGLAVGLAGCLALSRLLRGLLAGVEVSDPVPVLLAAVLLAAAAWAGCELPARRAMREDPARVLSSE